jgi:DNA-binding NarL/FixJ family response regulator
LTCPGTQVLILTFTLKHFLFLALRAGAAGYVLKSTVDTELLNAIRVVAEGGAFFIPLAPRCWWKAMPVSTQSWRMPTASWSEREREVIRLITLGYTACEAPRLALSPRP